MAISFFSEDTSFRYKHRNKTKKWLRQIAGMSNKKIADLNYIFCSDDYLLQINLQYLNHNTYTDIITFDGSDASEEISGDIFISIDRVQENAMTLGTIPDTELLRVISHGLLHLIGYNDKSNKDKKVMRQKETEAIELFESI
ncbi:rRNA maturation RNase YbeY [Algoriphagus sp. C2-7]|uniref:Endoribonuclease YbeY n=2 Tax=Algoriphagus sediminis TaxID=3057113 RepID=A0ABT7YBR1_9BACT|nr:rRNA maturation RNase YbeY [Algoriphagus sediminis]MDN3203957.1 rRNA maturation RNase YbeY [Algoriphagus sediminis]